VKKKMIVRRRIDELELYTVFAGIAQKLRSEVGELPKDHVEVVDFAPEHLKPGTKVFDKVTNQYGEVIGYDERLLILRESEE
jgi:galactose-1-phosphate uridylyltransferase